MRIFCLARVAAVLLALGAVAAADEAAFPTSGNSRIRAAAQWVRSSQRYLHHDQLQRGMTGYGLTVMAGTEIVRFDVEIVSVLRNFQPQQDVILAKLSGLGLEKSGVVAGMSGSPVFVKDPSDGKEKMIGAVAYGWAFSNEPLTGIQPISQMLAAEGVPIPGLKENPTTTPAIQAGGRLDETWKRLVFDPAKSDFTQLGWPAQLRAAQGLGSSQAADAVVGPPQLLPVATPLMVGSLGEQARRHLADALAGTYLVPMQSGSAGADAAKDLSGASLLPGSAVSVALAKGDADISAIGTVTEMLDQRMLAFGHPMFGNGQVSLPIAPAYVHAIISSFNRSNKLGSAGPVVGELTSDEACAVSGLVGPKVAMVPMSVDVDWGPQGQTQAMRFQLVRDRMFTGLMATTLCMNSITGLRELPEEHHIEYSVRVDYGQAGVFNVSNFSSGASISPMTSDLSRVLGAMMNNPFATSYPQAIEVKLKVRQGSAVAKLTGLRLDRNRYAPGQTVTATMDLWRFHGERFTRTVQVRLPDNLADGQYTLRVGDHTVAADAVRRRMPELLDPRDLPGLLKSLQRIAEPRMDQAHAVLLLGRGGLTVERQAVPGVPPTIDSALRQSLSEGAEPIEEAVVAAEPLDVMIAGTQSVQVTVARDAPRP